MGRFIHLLLAIILLLSLIGGGLASPSCPLDSSIATSALELKQALSDATVDTICVQGFFDIEKSFWPEPVQVNR